MVLGLVKCLQNRGYEKLGGKLYIEATDIDELCVCMTYTQLSLLGLSVRVIHGNSLSGEIFSTWDSPNLQIANLSGYFNKIPNLFFCFIFLVWMVWNIRKCPFNKPLVY